MPENTEFTILSRKEVIDQIIQDFPDFSIWLHYQLSWKTQQLSIYGPALRMCEATVIVWSVRISVERPFLYGAIDYEKKTRDAAIAFNKLPTNVREINDMNSFLEKQGNIILTGHWPVHLEHWAKNEVFLLRFLQKTCSNLEFTPVIWSLLQITACFL